MLYADWVLLKRDKSRDLWREIDRDHQAVEEVVFLRDQNMEDPRNEIRDVVLGLTNHPSLKGQAAVLQKYFTQDVEFYNVWLNAKGLANLICIYNMGEVFLNYVGCEFQNIAYDETNNNLSVCVYVFIRPRAFLSLHLAYLRCNVNLELEDVVEVGTQNQKIK